jgi:hypothetical protein
MTLRIFDPPQCCSTGVCGPDVDPALVQFAADLKWLAARGVTVERYNLAQQPEAFVHDSAVREALSTSGTGVLPLIVAEGRIAAHSRYPDRDDLARIAGLAEAPADPTAERPLIGLDVAPSPGMGSCCGPDDACC